MCFKNLPIEFDANGKASLRDGVGDPYGYKPTPSKGYVRKQDGPGAQLAAPPKLRDWSIDPVTRVAGALAVHTTLDLENRKAVDAYSRAMLFRGYEIILQGRDPATPSTSARGPVGCAVACTPRSPRSTSRWPSARARPLGRGLSQPG